MVQETKKKRKLVRRTVKRRPDEVIVGRRAEWVLARIEGWSRDGWSSLKLMRNRIGPKNVWYLGAKDGRLANSRDAGILVERHPDVAAWVLEAVR